MKYFPISLNINEKQCVVIGGGSVAERKTLALLENGGQVTVYSPELTPQLGELKDKGAFQWVDRSYKKGDLNGAFLVIAATDDPEVQEAVYREANQQNILINVADVPKRCNFILPAALRRGDLTISVSTSGKSPALARKLRKELEEQFGDEYAIILDFLGEAREHILSRDLSHDENKSVFHKLVDCDMLSWIKNKQWDTIEHHFSQVLGSEVMLASLERMKNASR